MAAFGTQAQAPFGAFTATQVVGSDNPFLKESFAKAQQTAEERKTFIRVSRSASGWKIGSARLAPTGVRAAVHRDGSKAGRPRLFYDIGSRVVGSVADFQALGAAGVPKFGTKGQFSSDGISRQGEDETEGDKVLAQEIEVYRAWKREADSRKAASLSGVTPPLTHLPDIMAAIASFNAQVAASRSRSGTGRRTKSTPLQAMQNAIEKLAEGRFIDVNTDKGMRGTTVVSSVKSDPWPSKVDNGGPWSGGRWKNGTAASKLGQVKVRVAGIPIVARRSNAVEAFTLYYQAMNDEQAATRGQQTAAQALADSDAMRVRLIQESIAKAQNA